MYVCMYVRMYVCMYVCMYGYSSYSSSFFNLKMFLTTCYLAKCIFRIIWINRTTHATFYNYIYIYF